MTEQPPGPPPGNYPPPQPRRVAVIRLRSLRRVVVIPAAATSAVSARWLPAASPPQSGGYAPPPPQSGGYPPPPPPGGYPPAGPGYGGYGTQPQYDVGDGFSWAWNKFTKNAGPLIIATLVYALVELVVVGILVTLVLDCLRNRRRKS